MKIAIYPGTFDPVTNGHIDIINRAALIFDKVIIAVATNPQKKPLFSVAERMDMLAHVISNTPNIEIDRIDGLVVDYAMAKKAHAVIRGLRAVSDFEFELQMALVNRKLCEELITVFLMPHEKYSYLNSGIVKELATFGGNINCFVPEYVLNKIKEKLHDH
ncbi:pantetheine-phosphate adenylyltransferase [candidate division KSB1 bacterium]|nr:pantetheine-phosphate adenylyltransferase [candidate division KSB1 bacterium]RQW04048.1 MAG: pantetheine-phosphate adenylyltransferase [candidate division KSB1 bacterium]